MMYRTGLKVISVLLLLLAAQSAQARPDSTSISLGIPIYSQYLQNGLIINPAYAGTRGSLTGSLMYRSQWMGTDGAPVTQTLSVHSPLKDDRVGLGLVAQFMQYGFTRTAAIYGNYAYNIEVETGRVSFGLKAGIDIASTVYPDHNFLNDPGDPVFVNDKPYLLPNFGAGVYYYNDRFFGGFSLPSLLSYRKTGDGSVHPYHSFGQYDIILTGGGLFYLSELFKIKPSFLLNYSMENTRKLAQFDLNANLIIADLVWAGASWRTSEQVFVFIVQVQPTPQLMVGFSYDYPAGRMHSYSKGSTEFTIRYEFGSKISAANPRYF